MVAYLHWPWSSSSCTSVLLMPGVLLVHFEIKGLRVNMSNQNAALDDLHTELAAASCKLSAVNEL